MTYQYARIDLKKTDYSPTVEWQYIKNCNKKMLIKLNNIYRTYCLYKNFASVMPVFESQYKDPKNDVIGYYDQGELVAWSLIHRFDQNNALCQQFAWTYHQPKMSLGIETLKTECAIYRDRGFGYLYLDQAHLYKQSIQGFELLGPIT